MRIAKVPNHEIQGAQQLFLKQVFREPSQNQNLGPDYMRPVRTQIGLHTNACFCLHEAGLKNHLVPVSVIPVAELTRVTWTGLKLDHGTM